MWRLIITLTGLVAIAYGSHLLYLLLQQGYNYLNKSDAGKLTGSTLLILTGFVSVQLSLRSFYTLKQKQRLEKKHRGKPWMWRADWSQGKSAPKSRFGMGSLLPGLFWCSAMIPILLAAGPEMKKDTPLVFFWFFTYGFPIIGIFLVLNGIRQWSKFLARGRAYLLLRSFPIRQGEKLQVSLAVPISGNDINWKTTLICLHKYTRVTKRSDGTSYEPVRDELWKAEMDNQVARGRHGNELVASLDSIASQLPNSGVFTGEDGKKGEIIWIVEVIATNNKGKTKLDREFEIPVFSRFHTPSPSSIDNMNQNSPSTTSPIPKSLHEPAIQEKSFRSVDSIYRYSGEEFNETISHKALNKNGITINNSGITISDHMAKNSPSHKASTPFLIMALIFALVPPIAIYNMEVSSIIQTIGIGFLIFFELFSLVFFGFMLFIRYGSSIITFQNDGVHARYRLGSIKLGQRHIAWGDIDDVLIRRSGSYSNGSTRGNVVQLYTVYLIPRTEHGTAPVTIKDWKNDQSEAISKGLSPKRKRISPISISPALEDIRLLSDITELIKLEIKQRL